MGGSTTGFARAIAVLVAAIALSPDAKPAPAFTGLGLLPLGERSFAFSISGDGAVVVGSVSSPNLTPREQAFRWSQAVGFHPLGTLVASDKYSGGAGTSHDGAVVVGTVGSEGGDVRAFRWTEETGMQDLGVFPSESGSSAYAVSGDGNVVVGYSGHFPVAPYTDRVYRAFRWQNPGGMQDLGTLSGDDLSIAQGANADGEVVVGLSGSQSLPQPHYRAFRWTPGTGMESLGTLPDAVSSEATAVSADGSVVAGYAFNYESESIYARAFRWTQGGGMQDLGVLPGGRDSYAQGISADGATILGWNQMLVSGDYHAIFWNADLGMVDLNTFLPSVGLDLSGWTLAVAYAASADGKTMTGYGYHDGHIEAWVATIPGPCAEDLTGDRIVTDADFVLFAQMYDVLECTAPEMPAGCKADLNGDGLVEDADFVIFARAYSDFACP